VRKFTTCLNKTQEYFAQTSKPHGTVESKEPAMKARFSFNEAQAFFNGKDLRLPSNEPVLILKMLAESFGEVVKHKDLDSDSGSSSASDMLKGRIRIIKRALNHYNIPCNIESKRGVGYVLQQAQTTAH